MKPTACARCNGSRLEDGALKSPRGTVFFQLDKTPFLTLSLPDIQVCAVMCLDCGHIEMRGDVRKAREISDSN